MHSAISSKNTIIDLQAVIFARIRAFVDKNKTSLIVIDSGIVL